MLKEIITMLQKRARAISVFQIILDKTQYGFPFNETNTRSPSNVKQTNYVSNRHSKLLRNPWTLLFSIDLSVLFFSYYVPSDSEPHSHVRLTIEASGVDSNDLPGRCAFLVALFVKLCHDT